MPGLRGALSVRVSDGQTDRIVTHYCRGLKFTKTAPGGHQALSFTMVLPRNRSFNDLGPEDRVYVYDARSGRTVIEGYLENPTPIDGPDGQQYEISAVGGMALASDETRALIYVDRSLDGWEKFSAAPASASSNAESYNDPGVPVSGIRCQFTPGAPIGTGAVAATQNHVLQQAGAQLGALTVTTQSGRADVNYTTFFYPFSGGATAIGTVGGLGTGAVTNTLWIGAGFFASGSDSILLELSRSGGATTVGTDDVWTNFLTLVILGRRMDRNGNLLSTDTAHGSVATSVLASRVVEDLLGRLLTFCDAGTAQVDATTFAIDQLAWPGGVKAADVLTKLSDFEADYLWEILETNDAGKHLFNYRAWPTTPRYVIGVHDGWQQRGGDVDLCNRISVSWTDLAGNPQSTPITAASLGLTGIGSPIDALGTRVKDADPVTLPDGLGSLANATRIGGQILTDKINPPKSGTAVVRRPVLDLLTGACVQPWEIEAGYLAQVRETGDVLRITQVDYDDDTCSMALTLGTPLLTEDQRLAKLVRAA